MHSGFCFYTEVLNPKMSLTRKSVNVGYDQAVVFIFIFYFINTTARVVDNQFRINNNNNNIIIIIIIILLLLFLGFLTICTTTMTINWHKARILIYLKVKIFEEFFFLFKCFLKNIWALHCYALPVTITWHNVWILIYF